MATDMDVDGSIEQSLTDGRNRPCFNDTQRAYFMVNCHMYGLNNVIAAVRKGGMSDFDFVLAIIKNHGFAIRFTTAAMKSNYGLVLAACTSQGLALGYASASLRNCRRIVSAACASSGGKALQYASIQLQDSFTVVIQACRSHGQALKYVSPRLRNSFTVARAACTQDGHALQYTSPLCRENVDIVKCACANNGSAYQYAQGPLQANVEIAEIAFSNHGFSLGYAPVHIRDNKKLAMVAVQQCADALEFVSPRLKQDKDVVLLAAAHDFEWSMQHPGRREDFALCNAPIDFQYQWEGRKLLKYVYDQVRTRVVFCREFLLGMKTASCPLSRLNIGEETPIAKLIASFLGVERQRESLLVLHKAVLLLARYMHFGITLPPAAEQAFQRHIYGDGFVTDGLRLLSCSHGSLYEFVLKEEYWVDTDADFTDADFDRYIRRPALDQLRTELRFTNNIIAHSCAWCVGAV